MKGLSVSGMVAFGATAVCAVLAVAGVLPFAVALLVGAVMFGALSVEQAVAGLRHRREASRFAAEHGWQFTPRTAAFTSRLEGRPFDLPGRHRQEDVLRGEFAGVRCATFTHVVETVERGTRGPFDRRAAGGVTLFPRTHRRDRTSRQLFQVTLAELPVDLPRLDIVPESIVHRAAQALGAMDVEVESHAFNERWRVTAVDRRYAHDVIDPRMIARLLEWDAHGESIRIAGAAVMLWRPGRDSTGTLARRLGLVSALAKRIPDHVIRRAREEGEATARFATGGASAPPGWATTPGALTSGRYTGIGVDGDGDGQEDWERLHGRRLGTDGEPR